MGHVRLVTGRVPRGVLNSNLNKDFDLNFLVRIRLNKNHLDSKIKSQETYQ